VIKLRRFSWTISIILVNFVILLSIEFMGGPSVYNLLKIGGQFGPLVSSGEWYRIVTAMFVHAGWLHLLFNMYALYYLGMLVENLYGASKFLTVYFVSGIVGNLLSQVFYYSVPSVGASGAIFGLVGLLLAATYFRSDFPSTIRRTMYVILLPMVIFNIAYGFMPGTDINNAAHLGGFGAGLLFGLIIPVGQSWGIKKKLWGAAGIFVLIVAFASFVGLATNNSVITLQPTINFANSYSKILYSLEFGYSVTNADLNTLTPFNSETKRLKEELLSYIRNGYPELRKLSSEYNSWLEMIKKRYKGLIGVEK